MNQLVAEVKALITDKPIILIVDDQYADDLQRQQSMVNNIGLPGITTKFVGSCEEAIEAFRQETNIVLCFLDCMLPESRDTTSPYDPDQDNHARGIEIIDTILEINKKILIAIYSSYVGEPQLRKKANQHENIIDCFGKEKPIKDFYVFVYNTLEKLGFDLSKLKEIQIEKKQKQVKKQNYDYSQLDPQTSLLIQEKASEIKKLAKRASQDIFDIGRYLIEVKETLQHGKFLPWVDAEFGWSPRTANRFMKVYSRFKSVKMSNLNMFLPSALYELSANSITQDTLNETLELAESGITINTDLVKSIKKKHSKTKTGEEKNNNTSANAINNTKLVSESISDTTTTESKKLQAEENAAQQDIVKIIPQQNLWCVGQHQIFWGEPNSEKFINLLPPKISLCLSFPQDKKWQFNHSDYDSAISIYSKYPDLDIDFLLESISRSVSICTGSDDIIAICYIPHPSILSIIDQLECQAYIADPSKEKCQLLLKNNNT